MLQVVAAEKKAGWAEVVVADEEVGRPEVVAAEEMASAIASIIYDQKFYHTY